MTAYFRQAFDSFDDIAALPHDAAAKLIEDRDLDILVDLAGHTRGTRLELFAYRPAPISANYLGYSATVGAPYIDYLITDPRQLSPGAEAHFTEALVQLPDSFMAARPAEISERRLSRAELGPPEDAIVFANFNKHYKHESRMFAQVMRLLKRLPSSLSDLTKTRNNIANSLLYIPNSLQNPKILVGYTLSHWKSEKALAIRSWIGSPLLMIRSRFLSAKERTALQAVMRHPSETHGVARRANAILLLDDGWNCAKVAEALYLDDDTVRTWFKRYQAGGLDEMRRLIGRGEAAT